MLDENKIKRIRKLHRYLRRKGREASTGYRINYRIIPLVYNIKGFNNVLIRMLPNTFNEYFDDVIEDLSNSGFQFSYRLRNKDNERVEIYHDRTDFTICHDIIITDWFDKTNNIKEMIK